MITTQVQFSDFWQWLQSSDSYKNNFSYEGAKALFKYLEEMSEEAHEPMDFDPVAWCCEFSEYKNLDDFNQQHFSSNIEGHYKNIDELNDHTIAISESPLVIADF